MSAFGIHEGQEVWGPDGRRIGRVVAMVDGGWVLEKGTLLPKRSFVAFGDVARLDGQVVHLSREPRPWPRREEEAASALSEGTEEVRAIPLRDELAEAKVRTAEAGRVRIRKVVREEQKTFVVHLMREELIVERLPPSDVPDLQTLTGSPLLDAGPLTFVLREDKVDIKKYSVVREVVRVRRERHHEERTLETTVRREEAEVERQVEPGEGVHVTVEE